MEKKIWPSRYAEISIKKTADNSYNIKIQLKPTIKGKDVVTVYEQLLIKIDNWATENKIDIVNLSIEKNEVKYYLLPYYLAMFRDYFRTPFSINGFIPVTVLPRTDKK